MVAVLCSFSVIKCRGATWLVFFWPSLGRSFEENRPNKKIQQVKENIHTYIYIYIIQLYIYIYTYHIATDPNWLVFRKKKMCFHHQGATAQRSTALEIRRWAYFSCGSRVAHNSGFSRETGFISVCTELCIYFWSFLIVFGTEDRLSCASFDKALVAISNVGATACQYEAGKLSLLAPKKMLFGSPTTSSL